jgi:hypothetical protein
LRIIDLLLAQRPNALHEAVSRLRTVDGLPGLPRDVSAATGTQYGALVAALALPLSFDNGTYKFILQAGLRGFSNAYSRSVKPQAWLREDMRLRQATGQYLTDLQNTLTKTHKKETT